MSTARFLTSRDAKPARDRIETGAYITSEAAYSASTILDGLDTLDLLNLSETGRSGVSMGWNYLDSVLLLINGVNLIHGSGSSYQQTQNQAKGSMMIASSAVQFLFTYQEFIKAACLTTTSLAGPAFAFGTLMDWIIGMMDLYDAAKRADFDGWLEETLAEIRFLDSKLEEEISPPDRVSFENKRRLLLQQMSVRCKVHCYDAADPAEKEERAKKIESVIDKANTTSVSTDTTHSFTAIKSTCRQMPNYREVRADRKIQQDLQKNLRMCQKNFFIKTVSLVGMCLLAVSTFTCPPAFVAGMIITGMVAAYYLGKNGYTLGKFISSGGVFKSKKESGEQSSINSYVPLKTPS